MNSIDVRTLKNELHRFEPKPCRSCRLILGFSILVFVLSVALALYASQRVPASAVIPVSSIPAEKPISRAEEKEIMDELRDLAKKRDESITPPHTDGHTHAPTKEAVIRVESIKP